MIQLFLHLVMSHPGSLAMERLLPRLPSRQHRRLRDRRRWEMSSLILPTPRLQDLEILHHLDGYQLLHQSQADLIWGDRLLAAAGMVTC